MAKYFNQFPKTVYATEKTPVGVDSVTNIISRFSFQNELKENIASFYKYQIKDSDTPEIIAHKYYGDSERHWIVLMFNDIVDPQFDWPMPYSTFINYVDSKYTANGAAQNVSLKTFTTTSNGTTPTFALGFTPAGSNAAVFVSIGGIVQTDGTDYAIQPANSSISFVGVPPAGEIVRVTGLENVLLYPQPNVSVSVYETTANGNTITFGLPFYPASREVLTVTIDGVVQPLSAYTVDTSANTITFDAYPANNELVRVATMYTAVNPYLILANTVTFDQLHQSVRPFINTSFATANSAASYANSAFTTANAAATTGKAIAMTIVFGG